MAEDIRIAKALKPYGTRIPEVSTGVRIPDISDWVSSGIKTLTTGVEIHPYPHVYSLKNLNSGIVTFTGSEGTIVSRNCPFLSTTSDTLNALNLSNLIIQPSNMVYLFISPYTNSPMPCHMVVEPAPNSTLNQAYWADPGGNAVSEVLTAVSFIFAVVYSGLSLVKLPQSSGGDSWLVNLVLYVQENFENGSRVTRFEGPGNCKFLPWPYDPDKPGIYGHTNKNGLVRPTTQPGNTMPDYFKVNHGLTVENDVVIT